MPQYIQTQARQHQQAGYGQAPAGWHPQQQPDNHGQFQSPNRVTSPDQLQGQSRYYQPQEGSYQQQQQNPQQPYQQQQQQQQQQQNYYPQHPQQRSKRNEYGHNANNSQDSYGSGGSGGDYRQPQQYQQSGNYYQPQQQQQQQGYRPSSQQSAQSARSGHSAQQYGRSSPQRSASPPKKPPTHYQNNIGGNGHGGPPVGSYGYNPLPRAQTFQGVSTNAQGNYSNPDLSAGMQNLSLEGNMSDYRQQQPYFPQHQGQPLPAPNLANPDARHGSVPNFPTYRDNYDEAVYYQQQQQQQQQYQRPPLPQPQHQQQNRRPVSPQHQGSYPSLPQAPPSNAPSGVSSSSPSTGAVSRAPYPLDDNVMGSFDLGNVSTLNESNRHSNNSGHQMPQQSQQQEQQLGPQQVQAKLEPVLRPPRRATTLPVPDSTANGWNDNSNNSSKNKNHNKNNYNNIENNINNYNNINSLENNSNNNNNNLKQAQPIVTRNKIPPAVVGVKPPATPDSMSFRSNDVNGRKNVYSGSNNNNNNNNNGNGVTANGTVNRAPNVTPPGERKQPPPPVRMYNNESVASTVMLAATNGSSGGDNDDESMSVTVDEVPAPSLVTISELESIRHSAKLAPTDTELQVKYAKCLAEAAVILASKYSDPTTPAGASAVVDTKTERKNRDTWNTQSLKILKKVIGQHVSGKNRTAITDAMFFLATNYGSGGKLGLEPDYDKAHDLYSRAARLDHPESCYRVAVCSEIGAGTRRDAGRALQSYKQAAQLGDVSAMYKLGMIALNGLLGQPRDFMDGFAWLQRAADRADHTNPHAVHELGLLYERGQSPGAGNGGGGGGKNGGAGGDSNGGAAVALSAVIVKDESRALELFMRAARLGYPPSQYRLGAAYEYGTLGRAVDPKRSIAWYSLAAERGEPESELALSGWYLTGSNGVLQQSDTEAYLWTRRAAEKGLAKAEYALGYFVEVGIGVKPDLEEAKRWYFKAAAQKHPKALSRLQELRSAKH